MHNVCLKTDGTHKSAPCSQNRKLTKKKKLGKSLLVQEIWKKYLKCMKAVWKLNFMIYETEPLICSVDNLHVLLYCFITDFIITDKPTMEANT